MDSKRVLLRFNEELNDINDSMETLYDYVGSSIKTIDERNATFQQSIIDDISSLSQRVDHNNGLIREVYIQLERLREELKAPVLSPASRTLIRDVESSIRRGMISPPPRAPPLLRSQRNLLDRFGLSPP